MTRRHHRRLSTKRRQLSPLFAADDSTPASDPPVSGGTSSSNAASQPQLAPAGDPSTTNAGNKGNTGNSPASGNNSGGQDGPPIGHPSQPNPVASPTPSAANSPSQPTGSSIVPSADPFPPQGANQSQQQSVPSPSSTSNAPSRTPVVSSGPNSAAANSPTSSSSASPSSASSLVASPTRSSPTVVAAPANTILPSSSPFAFNSLNPAATSLVGPHSTISGLVPTATNPSSAISSSSSISTPAIVGIAAGGLCGLAILGAVCIWIGKRVSRYMETRELEPPPMHELVADEDPAVISRRLSGPGSAPRPPTMIERANLAGRGNGFYNDNNNGFSPQNNFSPYAVDPRFGNASPFAPSQYYPGAPAPAPQAFFSPIASPSPFDDSAAAVPSAPGTPVYFSRQNSVHSGFGTVPHINNDAEPQLPNPYDAPVARTNDGYATLNRNSGPSTPQRRYTDLAHQLSFSSPNDRTISPAPSTGSYATVPLVPNNTGITSSPRSPSFKAIPMSPSVVNVPSDLHEDRATPVQFGFTTPAATGSVPSVLTPASGPTSNNAQTFTSPGISASQSASSQSSRPETVYDEEDAYTAI